MIIALDIGGTKIKAGIVSNNKIIRKIKIDSGNTKEEVIRNILDVIYELMDKRVKGISIGVPGPADYSKGVIGDTRNIPLKNVNLKKIISSKFKKKIVFENDANCFVLGEAIRLRKKNIVGLTLGTGVGGGIVIDGKLYRGCGNAGELGHCVIKYDGLDGFNKGDLETYVSASALKRRYGKLPPNIPRKSWKDVGIHLGVAIADIVYAFDPELVVLGGGMTHQFDLFKSAMMKEISKRKVKVKVVKGSLDSGIIGAGALIESP